MLIAQLSGYHFGKFVKEQNSKSIWYVGLAPLLFVGLHYMKWVQINANQIEADCSFMPQ